MVPMGGGGGGATLTNISPSTALRGAFFTSPYRGHFSSISYSVMSPHPPSPFSFSLYLLERRTFSQVTDTILRTGMVPAGVKGIRGVAAPP